MALFLPQSAVLLSDFSKRYVYYMTESEPVGYVSILGEDICSTYSKIELERSTVNSRFVHLRFSYSNKYWARHSPTNNNIICTSDQPEEDTSKWSCTLFEPTVGPNGFVHLIHVQSGKRLRTVGLSAVTARLFVDERDSGGGHHLYSFTMIEWDSIVQMPDLVTFKGYNDKYLKATWIERHEYHQFSSDDGNEEATAYEITRTRDGHIRIKSNFFGKFWRRSPNWIWADSTDTVGNNIDTLFWPVKVDDSTIALRNAGNTRFCSSLTADRKTDCLNAAVSTITTEARLRVEELVFERAIFDVRFQMDNARIFNERPVLAGVKTEITTGIPRIAEGKIEISAEVTKAFEWSRTTSETKTSEVSYTTAVPPMSRVVVRYVATQGTSNIPFTYVQRDRLSGDGSFRPTQHNDGVYTGVNYYSFHFEQPNFEPL